jgi:hypothetical protein
MYGNRPAPCLFSFQFTANSEHVMVTDSSVFCHPLSFIQSQPGAQAVQINPFIVCLLGKIPCFSLSRGNHGCFLMHHLGHVAQRSDHQESLLTKPLLWDSDDFFSLLQNSQVFLSFIPHWWYWPEDSAHSKSDSTSFVFPI